MTILAEHSAIVAKDPRGLLSSDVFELLVADIRRHHPVTRRYAERMMGQALVFLKANGTMLQEARSDPSRWVRIAPSMAVDPAWHAFILRSQLYHTFCIEIAACYMHHMPAMDEDLRSGAALERTIPLLKATGYHVDMEFWSETDPEFVPLECHG